MKHTLSAYFTVNGMDFTRFPVVEFPVPDDLYDDIQTVLRFGRPLRSCPFYGALLDLAREHLDLDAFRPDYADLFPEQGSVSVSECVIEDPGDRQRLEDRVRGLPVPDDSISLENDNGTRRFSILLFLDDDGRILSVTDVQAEGLESESANGSSWAPCYPDYDRIAETIIKESRHG